VKAVLVLVLALVVSACDDPCSDGPPIAPPPPFVLTVVDAETEVLLHPWVRVRHEDYEQVCEEGDEYCSFWGQAARYEIEIAMTGYRDVFIDDFVVEDAGLECPEPATRELRVELEAL
jgi:hypothetical protein